MMPVRLAREIFEKERFTPFILALEKFTLLKSAFDICAPCKLLSEKFDRLISALLKFEFVKFPLLKSVREAITPSKFASSANEPAIEALIRFVLTNLELDRLLFLKSEALKSVRVKSEPEKLNPSMIRLRLRQFCQFTEGPAESSHEACAAALIKTGEKFTSPKPRVSFAIIIKVYFLTEYLISHKVLSITYYGKIFILRGHAVFFPSDEASQLYEEAHANLQLI